MLLRDVLRGIVLVCAIIAILTFARRERVMRSPSGDGAIDLPLGHAAAIKANEQLRDAEKQLAAAKEDLAATIARLDEQKKIQPDAPHEQRPARPVAVVDQAALDRQALDEQLNALRRRLEEAEAESAKTKKELDKVRLDAQKALGPGAQPAAIVAKRPADPNTLGRGAIVDQQTKFDNRRFRDPDKPAFVPNAAAVAAAGSASAGSGGGMLSPGSTAWGDKMRGEAEFVRAAGQYNLDTSKSIINLQTAKSMEMENRLRWTETFFEMRRVNRTNRALEAGPRPTIEQVVTYARMQAPRRLTSLQLDPLTGDISWPRVLTDAPYKQDRDFIQEQFRLRANAVGSVDFAQFETVEAAITAFKEKLKANVAKYPPAKYGEGRGFLDSLRREFELPLNP